MAEYGLQLYSVRDAMKENVPSTIEKVAKMGYRTVEFAGYYGYSAKEIVKMLDGNGLKVVGAHTGLSELTDDKLNATLDFMREIGNKNIVIPSAPYGNKGAQAETIARINKVQPIIEKAGFKLSYHNHSGEFQKKFFTPIFYPELLAKTKVGLEIDTFWAFNAGKNPLQMMDELKSRLNLIHLKDGFAKKGFFKPAKGMSLGSGEAPVKAVLDKALKMGIPIIVESETQQPDGISEVKRCIDFLKAQNK